MFDGCDEGDGDGGIGGDGGWCCNGVDGAGGSSRLAGKFIGAKRAGFKRSRDTVACRPLMSILKCLSALAKTL